MAFIGEHPQVELTPVATDDKEVCEGDAFPLCRLPELLAGLAQRASKDATRAGDGDLWEITHLCTKEHGEIAMSRERLYAFPV